LNYTCHDPLTEECYNCLEKDSEMDDYDNDSDDALEKALTSYLELRDKWGCPICLNITSGYSSKGGYCRKDGAKLHRFAVHCSCGKEIPPYCSTYNWKRVLTSQKIIRIWKWQLHYGGQVTYVYQPKPLSEYCTVCGRPCKQPFDAYLDTWKEKHESDRVTDEIIKSVRYNG